MEGYFGDLPDFPKKHPGWNKAFTVLEFAFIPFALWWIPYFHLPAPGWAVAFIACAAAAMSVHDDMSRWQKGLWMLLIGVFLVTELRAISKDRAEVQHQASVDRQAQDTAFEGVLQKQNEQFAATAEGFSSTYTKVAGVLKKTQEVSNETKENLQTLTGGDSWGWVGIGPRIDGNPNILSLAITNESNKYVLRSVHLQIIDISGGFGATAYPRCDVGDVPPGMKSMFLPPSCALRPNPSVLNTFFIIISANNGATQENITLFKQGESWGGKTRVTKTIKGKSKLLKEF